MVTEILSLASKGADLGDHIELDVIISKDDKIVVSHDAGATTS